MNYQTKRDLLDKTDAWLELAQKSRAGLKKSGIVIVSKKDFRSIMRNTAADWFDTKPELENMGMVEDELKKYDAEFERLIRLSATISKAKSYDDVLGRIMLLLTELTVRIGKVPTPNNPMWGLENVLVDVNIDKIDGLGKAVRSAHERNYDDAIRTGWDAAMSIVHQKIMDLGYEEFNKRTAALKLAEKRYKKFSGYRINSYSDLQRIHERDLLWILESFDLLDKTQHDRLVICLTIRHGSSHAGKIEISPENVLSFFSDLAQIIFGNPTFVQPDTY